MIRHLLNLDTILLCFRVVAKECKCFSIITYFKVLIFEYYFTNAQQYKAQNIADSLIFNKKIIGHYLIAKVYFVNGLYETSIKQLSLFLESVPNHADAIYLLARAYKLSDNSDLSWQKLAALLKYSKRKRTWLELANLVETESEFINLKQLWQYYHTSDINSCADLVTRDYLSIGALRAKQYSFSIALWQETLEIIQQKKLIGKLPRSTRFTVNKASIALSDLKTVMDGANIPFFLISGTLLGCIRENALLSHDKDIDIGIDSMVDFDRVIKTVTSCGFFFILPQRSHHLVRIKHINGVSIDIFRHFKEQHDYWHGGVKSVWHNTCFNLTNRHFLGKQYLIPENYDLYLTENYGADWAIPKPNFDSTLDTPNAEIVNKYEMLVYCYKKIFDMYLYNKLDNDLLDKYTHYIEHNSDKG